MIIVIFLITMLVFSYLVHAYVAIALWQCPFFPLTADIRTWSLHWRARQNRRFHKRVCKPKVILFNYTHYTFSLCLSIKSCVNIFVYCFQKKFVVGLPSCCWNFFIKNSFITLIENKSTPCSIFSHLHFYIFWKWNSLQWLINEVMIIHKYYHWNLLEFVE